MSKILRDCSVFAKALRMIFSHNGVRRNILIVRSFFEERYKNCSDVVITYDKVWAKDDNELHLLSNGTPQLIRKTLTTGVYYDLDDLMKENVIKEPEGKLAETSLEILLYVKEVRLEKGRLYWEFEPANQMMYLRLGVLSNKYNSMSFSFSGLVDQNSPYNKNSPTAFSNVVAMTEALASLMVITKGGSRKKNVSNAQSFTTISTLKSQFSVWRTGVTKKNLDVYFRSRHEIVFLTVANYLGIVNGRSDMSPKTLYDYHGVDCMKTPDLFYYDNESAKTYIVDVAVTNGDVNEVYEGKVLKYATLAGLLEYHNESPFVSEALVVSSTLQGVMRIPEFMSNIREVIEDIQEDIIKLQNQMSEMANYQVALAAFKADENEETLKEKEGYLDAFLTAYFKFVDISGKRSSELMDSFDKKVNDLDINFTSVENDVLVNKIKKSYKDFNEDETMAKIFGEIMRNIREERVPQAIRNIHTTFNADDVVNSLLEEAEMLRRKFKSNVNNKVPKLFKYPDLTMLKKGSAPEMHDDLGRCMKVMLDGTRKYSTVYTILDDDYQENREGIGLNKEDDVRQVEELMGMMRMGTSLEFRRDMEKKFPEQTPLMDALFGMRLVEVTYSLGRLARNLVLMEGRRVEEGSQMTVFKSFPEDGYGLAVLGGSRITTEAQIRYKIITLEGPHESEFFHSLTETHYDSYETKWLSISMSDLQTLTCLFEKTVNIISQYVDCYEEGKGSKVDNIYEFIRKPMIMMPILLLMEMKRGTSTTSQYNRYILNSMTAFLSDKERTMKDIMTDPVRSRMEAYVRIRQMEWAKDLHDMGSSIWLKSVVNTTKTSSDYDSFMIPSIFSEKESVEFTFLMNDIYLGNLFQKAAGFMGHKTKAIISKQTKEERHFLKIRNSDTMNADLTVDDCFVKADMKHVYCQDFVMLAGHKLGKKLKANPKYKETIVTKMTDNIHGAMMMTSSLLEPRVKSSTLYTMARKRNEMSHLTMKKLIEEHGTSTMMSIVSRENLIEAMFSMFPKSQIGGPREILIQSYKLRCHMKIFENLCEGFCDMHPKEMLTKGRTKEDLQSSGAMEFKKKLLREKSAHKNLSLMPAIVADASRWAPSFVMQQFITFLIAMQLPKEVEDHAVATMKSFSAKIMHLPDALISKWDKKPVNQPEAEEDMEWIRKETASDRYVARVMSGMGQGMFHRFSSLIHVAKDDVLDELLQMFFRRKGITMSSNTLISSDDLLKQMLITGKDIEALFGSFQSILTFYEVTNMLCNIHTNWKKTAMSLAIHEFNSYFTKENRASLAVIKDLYTALEPVDLTEPEKAVKAVVSNISRTFRNGAHLPTVTLMFSCMREWLKDSYAMKDTTIASLCDMLKCTEDFLPADLGFLSTRHIIGQCIFGNDILLYDSENSQELNKFYKCTFTGIRQEIKETISEDYISALSGRIRLCLPYRMDKKLQKMIKEYHKFNELTSDSVYQEQEDISLFVDTSKMTWMNHQAFSHPYFMGVSRRYSHGEAMQIHTMVRALQFTGNSMISRPEVIELTSYNVVSYTAMILARDDSTSSMSIMAPYNTIMLKVEEAEKHFKNCVGTDGRRHTRRRKVTFRTRELVMSADIDEIILFMTGETTKLSNRLIAVLNDLCKMLNMDFADFSEDPVKSVREAFSFTKYPLLSFRKLVEEYINNRVNFSIDMMQSEIDQGNALDNLVVIYGERAEPSRMMKPKKTSYLSAAKEYFNTWVSACRKPEDFPFSLLHRDLTEDHRTSEISASDTPMDKGMKWILSNRLSRTVVSDHVFHKKHYLRTDSNTNDVVHYYSDLDDAVVMKVDHHNQRVHLELMSSTSIFKEGGPIAKFMIADIRGEGAEDYTKFYHSGLTSTEEYMTSRNKIHFTTEYGMEQNSWKMLIRLNWVNKVKFVKNDYVDFWVFQEGYVMHSNRLNEISNELNDPTFFIDFEALRNGEMDLNTLQSFMERNNLHKEEILGKYKVGTARDTTGVTSSSAEINGLGAHLTMEGMINMFTFNFNLDLTPIAEVNEQDNSDSENPEIEKEKKKVTGPFDSSNLPEDFLNILRVEMTREERVDIISVEPRERLYISRMIADNMIRAMENEFIFKNKELLAFMRGGMTDPTPQDAMSIRWDLLATQVHRAMPSLKDWFVRMLIAIIYIKISRKIRVFKPDRLALLPESEDIPDAVRFIELNKASQANDYVSSLMDKMKDWSLEEDENAG
jgi:hypothetical protein